MGNSVEENPVRRARSFEAQSIIRFRARGFGFGLITPVSVFCDFATDGSRTKNLAEKIEALREMRGRYRVLLTELERSGESQISLTDPDSRDGRSYQGRRRLQYPGRRRQVTNQVVDMGLLRQTAESARAILAVETIDVVADRAYFRSRTSRPARRRG